MNSHHENFIDGAVICKNAIVDLIWKQMESDDNPNLLRLVRLIERFDINTLQQELSTF